MSSIDNPALRPERDLPPPEVHPAGPGVAAAGAGRTPFAVSALTIVGLVMMVGALISATATFFILTGLSPITPTSTIIAVLLVANVVFVAGLIGCLLFELVKIVRARTRGSAGARLHVRIAGFFSVIAVVPAILVALVAGVTLNRGLDAWFSERTRAIVDNSLAVAQSYLREHGQVIRADVLAMANDLARARAVLTDNDERFTQFLNAQASIRALPAAFVLNENGEVLFEAETPVEREFLMPPKEAVAQAKDGQVILIAPGDSDQVGAIMRLGEGGETFLYVARNVDPQVIRYLGQTQATVAEYRTLEQDRTGVQIAFALVYIGFTLILLLASVWIGISFANRLVAPIRRLIGASREVASGNLDVRVDDPGSEGDLSRLSNTFNLMTEELRSQRNQLLDANMQLDERRTFIETVLAGVPAGVIGVDAGGKVSIINRTARDLISANNAVGTPVRDLLPEISHLLDRAEIQRQRLVQDQISIARGGRDRVVAIRVAAEQIDPHDHSMVITLDDITELIQAQRSSAWADVARRIAHEIKNPLTPIQLSAERLRRKYGKSIDTDRDVFDQCTDTIIRQVGDIGRMVDEFSTFARMPKPEFAIGDVAGIVRESVFLMRVGSPEIDIVFDEPEAPVMARFDSRLLSQALTNVIKNATEAVGAVPDGERSEKGRIEVRLGSADDFVVIDIIDNGIGLPAENRHRLLEPYVTTREKGTGLGLAIVQRILEDHHGRLELGDAPAVAEGGRGAQARLAFPAALDGAGDAPAGMDQEESPPLAETV